MKEEDLSREMTTETNKGNAAEQSANQGSSEIRRSVMSPVPISRSVMKNVAAFNNTKGLGRQFADLRRIPDLSLNSTAVLNEAQRILWSTLEKRLDEVVGSNRWIKTERDGTSVYEIREVSRQDAEILINSASSGLADIESGPGIILRSQPVLETGNRLDQGEVKHIVRIKLETGDVDGNHRFPASFTGGSSPGYQALMKSQGTKPFLLYGWLCFRHGDKLDGFRIVGTSDGNLEQLTTYDCLDVLLCIWEAFYRQRNDWAKSKVISTDGREIDTNDRHIIRLDPHDLRTRLDPNLTWGQNWRSKLYNKLRALAIFEHQEFSLDGKKNGKPTRLLSKVIDGHLKVLQEQPQDELILNMSKEKLLPSNDFFVELSVDLVNRHLVWMEENGFIHWGNSATNIIRKHRSTGDPVHLKRQSPPYYKHSPRLLTLSNLEGWSSRQRTLTNVMLQEMTPNRKTKKGVKARLKIGGRPYASVNGSHGKGYKVKTWIKKAGYVPGEGIISCRTFREFAEDLRHLAGCINLQLGFKNDGINTTEVLDTLDAYARNRRAIEDHVLLAYLPDDLEETLRQRLKDVGINALDAIEYPNVILRSRYPDGLSPARLRIARTKAGLTQEQLAEKIGVSRPTIAQWETGKREISQKHKDKLMKVIRHV